MSNLPLAALGLRAEQGTVVVNSRDVAEVFGKRHSDVLRDIDVLLANVTRPETAGHGHGADLRSLKDQALAGWFRETTSRNEAANRETRSFDLTRDGLMLLVMGYTGARVVAKKK